ncbi:unnamed protein product [Arabidopsis halleri]
MAKLLCSYLFICMFVLSGFLASSSAQEVVECRTAIDLGKQCDFQTCRLTCKRVFGDDNASGLCLGSKEKAVCTCLYNCKA